MKFFAFFVFLLPLAVAGQSKIDYERAMSTFQRFYNAGQGDSINVMFGHGWDEMKLTKALWTNADAAEYLKEYGKLESFKFIGIDESDPNKVYVYETVFSKAGTKTTSLTLDENRDLSTFRFITSSESISLLQRKQKRSS
jgi:hypothetical protein